jgi:hypothetical protein
MSRLKIVRVKKDKYNWFDTALGEIFCGILRLLTFGYFTFRWSEIAIVRRLTGELKLFDNTKWQ